MMMVVRHAVTHEHQVVASLDGIDTTVWELTGDDVPPMEACAYQFGDGGAAKVAPHLSFEEVVELYTATEVPRIFAKPELMQLLFLLRCFGVVLGSVQHIQGTALLASFGLLDGQRDDTGAIISDAPERVARILAGEKPE